MEDAVQEFEELVRWEVDRDGQDMPEPPRGLSAGFDNALDRVKAVKGAIYEELERVRGWFAESAESRAIKFTHSKLKYEIEVPEVLVNKNNKPKDLEIVN